MLKAKLDVNRIFVHSFECNSESLASREPFRFHFVPMIPLALFKCQSANREVSRVSCTRLMYTRGTQPWLQTAAIVTHNRVSIPKEPQTPREIRCDTCNTLGQSMPSRSLASRGRRNPSLKRAPGFLRPATARFQRASIVPAGTIII